MFAQILGKHPGSVLCYEAVGNCDRQLVAPPHGALLIDATHRMKCENITVAP